MEESFGYVQQACSGSSDKTVNFVKIILAVMVLHEWEPFMPKSKCNSNFAHKNFAAIEKACLALSQKPGGENYIFYFRAILGAFLLFPT